MRLEIKNIEASFHAIGIRDVIPITVGGRDLISIIAYDGEGSELTLHLPADDARSLINRLMDVTTAPAEDSDGV